jgi:hypothetical protein
MSGATPVASHEIRDMRVRRGNPREAAARAAGQADWIWPTVISCGINPGISLGPRSI